MTQGEEPSRAFFGPALELLALWALAAAQPVFELFGKNPEFFLASDTGPVEIVAFTVVVAFAVPALLIAVEVVVRLISAPVGDVLHRVFLGGLGALLGLNIARQLGLSGLLPALLVAGGIACGVLWLRGRPMARSAMRYLGAASLAFALLFVFTSDVRALVFEDDAPVLEVGAGSGGPVAVLVYDEFPVSSLLTAEGEINGRRFPNFDRLADMSTWYRNATAVNPSTPYSVPSILTGHYPEEDLLPTSADQPVNLFTLLGGSYEVDAFEGVTDLCPDSVCDEPADPVSGSQRGGLRAFVSDTVDALRDATVVYGHLTMPDPLRDELPPLDEGWAGFVSEGGGGGESGYVQGVEPVGADPNDGSEDDPRDFLADLAPAARSRGGLGYDLVAPIEAYTAERETMLVGHDPFLPHRPWHVTPSGAAYNSATPGLTHGEPWPDDLAFNRRELQRHLWQVGFADTLLGALLDRFEAAGTLDQATIVVVADHGISFEPGTNARAPTRDAVQEIMRVPMLVKGPGQAAGQGEVSDQNALLVDVVPTILDLLDIEPPADAGFDGQSLVDPGFERAPNDKPIFFTEAQVPGDFTDLLPIVERNAGWVGDGDWVDLLRVGDAGHFVGRRVDDVGQAPRARGSWSVDQAAALEDIDREARLPVSISGRVELASGAALPDQVLVVVDGYVAGVGDVEVGDGTFSALLDERRLGVGQHEVELYLPAEEDRIQPIVDG